MQAVGNYNKYESNKSLYKTVNNKHGVCISFEMQIYFADNLVNLHLKEFVFPFKLQTSPKANFAFKLRCSVKIW